MNEFLKDKLEECIGKNYINSIPIKEFSNLEELEIFIKEAKKKGLAANLKHETSNFYQGVLVQVYDIKACTVKEFLN